MFANRDHGHVGPVYLLLAVKYVSNESRERGLKLAADGRPLCDRAPPARRQLTGERGGRAGRHAVHPSRG